jgi:hypothetical protein
MKLSKISIWLSLAIAVLVLITSSAGLFVQSIYAREALPWRVQAYGQDITNIVAVAALLVAVYFVSRGSFKAFLVWAGVLISLIYPYIIYAFDVHFNSLFLVYVAIVGLSFYTLLSSTIHSRLASLQPHFSATTRRDR